jgi:hypothetical protein
MAAPPGTPKQAATPVIRAKSPKAVVPANVNTSSYRALLRSGGVEPDSIPVTYAISASERPVEPSTHCSICLEPFDNRAVVKPCGHNFDLECIRIWLNQTSSWGTQCPVCKTKMAEVQHDFSGKNFNTQNVNAIRGVDERQIKQNASQKVTKRERHAALEQRRLLEMPNLTYEKSGTYLNITIQHEDDIVTVKRDLSLIIKQRQLKTLCNFLRTLTLTYAPTAGTRHRPTQTISTDATSLILFQEAEQESGTALIRWFQHGDNFSNKMKWNHPEIEFRRGKRGIDSILKSSVRIEKIKDEERVNLKFSWETILEERGPAHADNDADVSKLMDESEFRKKLESRLSYDVQQIQGALAWLRKHHGKDWLKGFERGSTNILEPYSGQRCTKCSNVHRYGDCLLPWN